MMKETLSKSALLLLLDKLMQPEKYSLSEQEGDKALHSFCAGCPDPVKARWLVVECLDPMTDEEIVDHALAMLPNPSSGTPNGAP